MLEWGDRVRSESQTFKMTKMQKLTSEGSFAVLVTLVAMCPTEPCSPARDPGTAYGADEVAPTRPGDVVPFF